MFMLILFFFMRFSFLSYEPVREGQTDGRTDERTKLAVPSIRMAA